MAYDRKGLRRLNYGGNFGTVTPNIWHYASGDAAAVVVAANYFNSASTELVVGDLILCSLVLGGTTVAKTYIVTAIAAGVVTVVAQA